MPDLNSQFHLWSLYEFKKNEHSWFRKLLNILKVKSNHSIYGTQWGNPDVNRNLKFVGKMSNLFEDKHYMDKINISNFVFISQ